VTTVRRLLLYAYACDPNRGSEPGAGWAFLKGALNASQHVTLVTRTKNAKPVLGALTAAERDRVRIISHDLSGFARWLKKRTPFGTQIYYLIWQLRTISLVRSLHAEQSFDLAHHVTFAVDWQPTALAYQKDLKFIWGPVGGGQIAPRPLRRFLGIRGRLIHFTRRIAVRMGYRLFGRRAARRCVYALAMNSDVAAVIARNAPTEVFPNIVVPPVKRRRQNSCEISILGVGRLEPWKAWSIAIEALKLLPTEFRLMLVGGGPDRQRLLRLARRLELTDRVTVVDPIPRAEVIRLMSEAHCLIHPTLHDSSSWVAAEAVAVGLPVVALNLAGPRDVLQNTGNELVDWRRPDVVGNVAHAVLTVRVNTQALNLYPQERITHFLPSLYERVLTESGPELGSR